ncbi:MAG: DUF3081 family protein [Psychrobium sp.]
MALHNYLKVFNKILEHGVERDGKCHYRQVSAWHDFDGYTCFLGYKTLTMTIYFHNKYTIESSDRIARGEFESLINKIARD